jgi:hypothetical protein
MVEEEASDTAPHGAHADDGDLHLLHKWLELLK